MANLMPQGITGHLTALLMLAVASVQASGFVGCMYEPVCLTDEICWTDHVFGLCMSENDRFPDNINFTPSHDQLVYLNDLAERLLRQGHRWSHVYTQCMLQTHILSLKTGEGHDPSLCELVNNLPNNLPPGSRGVPALEEPQIAPPTLQRTVHQPVYTWLTPDTGFPQQNDDVISNDDVIPDIDVIPLEYENPEASVGDRGRYLLDFNSRLQSTPTDPEKIALPSAVEFGNSEDFSDYSSSSGRFSPTQATPNPTKNLGASQYFLPRAMKKRSLPPSINKNEHGAPSFSKYKKQAASINYDGPLYDIIDSTGGLDNVGMPSDSLELGKYYGSGKHNSDESFSSNLIDKNGRSPLLETLNKQDNSAQNIFNNAFMSDYRSGNELDQIQPKYRLPDNYKFDDSDYKQSEGKETVENWNSIDSLFNDENSLEDRENRVVPDSDKSISDLEKNNLLLYPWRATETDFKNQDKLDSKEIPDATRIGLRDWQQSGSLSAAFPALEDTGKSMIDNDWALGGAGLARHKTNKHSGKEQKLQSILDVLDKNEDEAVNTAEGANMKSYLEVDEPLAIGHYDGYPISKDLNDNSLIDGSVLYPAAYSNEKESSDNSIRNQDALIPNVDLQDTYQPLDQLEEFPELYSLQPAFTRNERLDTKKPGPWFGINNFAFDYESDGDLPDMTRDKHQSSAISTFPIPYVSLPADLINDDNFLMDDGNDINEESIRDTSVNVPSDLVVSPATDKIRVGGNEAPEFNQKFFKTKTVVATSKSSILLNIKQKVNGTKNAEETVKRIEEILKIPPKTFLNVRHVENSILFRVDPKYERNSEDVIETIEKSRDLIRDKLGIDILSVYEQSQYSSDVVVTPSLEKNSRESYLAPLAIVLSSLAALVVFLLIVLFACRFRLNGGKKYKNFEDGTKEKTTSKKTDHDASHHYQELCRSRMANKRGEKGDSPLKERSTRVQGLSRDSDTSANSPTSRSSTSSWSEEPAISNMDISTGHMVLSYMEDHLNNKDKLDKEWKALEKYEAEPSAASVAALPINKTKIRPNAQAPYDHNRVVLNPVTNADGGDFINASTLTDHDPRNPAYITTQGVLPETVNDFWQMVWEQGCVVIVMLTRLAESGTAMCCRYWPEEGSEVYHIYEVHLVSEHIWCDEYLVRSFYLKNRKTAETRTVTQFHFLAWPDQSVPSSVKAFLEFRRKANKSYRGRSCPMIVQCCDGASRTGTYCLIDMVLNRMAKGVKEIDLTATLEHVRDQRAAAVGSRQQFEFVLMAIAEEVHAIIKTVPQ